MSTGAELEPRMIPIMMMKVVVAMMMLMSRMMLMMAMLPFWCHALAQRNGGKVSQKRSGKEESGGKRVERGTRRRQGVTLELVPQPEPEPE